jgi:uncharacterized membrane protein
MATVTHAQHAPNPARRGCVLVLILGAVYGAVSPPLALGDELHHLARAYALSRGEVRVRETDHGFESELPVAFRRLAKVYGTMPEDPRRRVKGAALMEELVAKLDTSQRYQLHGPLHPHSPLAYLGMLPGVWLARVLSLPAIWLVYLARLSSLCVFAALLNAALARIDRLAWGLCTLALTPAILIQAAWASPDSLILALVFLFLAGVERVASATVDTPLPPRQRVELAAVFVALVCCSPACAMFGLVLPTLAWRHEPRTATRWGHAALLVGIGGAAAAALSYASTGHNPFALEPHTQAQLGWALTHPFALLHTLARSLFRHLDDYLLQFFAAPDLLSQQTRFSASVVAALYAELLVLLTLGAARGSALAPLKARWYALAAVLFVGSVFLDALLTTAKLGPGQLVDVYGRLFFPAAPLLVAALAQLGRPIAQRFLFRHGGGRVLLASVALNLVWLFFLGARFYAANERPWKY